MSEQQIEPVPSLRGRILRALLLLTALFAAAGGAAQLVWHCRLFAGRIGFPLDLEWMEGGMLVHAQRIAAGQPIYAPPSLDFIPFLYTPLYPAVVALASKVFPLGYVLGRVLSLLAFAAAVSLLVAAAVREGAGAIKQWALPVLIAVAGAGAVVAGFAFSGAFYDLARSDSLLLLLEAAALYAAAFGCSRGSGVWAGVFIALGFFTKQTASVIGLSIGVGLLIANWRRAVAYGAAATLVLGAGILWLTKASSGWFWTYVFKLHQSHAFTRKLAFVDTPRALWEHQSPLFIALALATIGLALGRQLRRSDAILWAAAIGGFVATCVGFGTQWAFDNAYIPAVYFPAFAGAVLGARLLVHAATALRPGAVVLAGLWAVAFGVHAFRTGRPDVARFVPQASDHLAAARFLDQLRALPGDGFVPFHPFYSALAGKRVFVHRMGVLDVGAALGRPAGLDQAIAERRFPFVILDWKSQPGEWPLLESRYHVVHEFREGVDAARMFSGAQTWPVALMTPTHDPAPLPAGGVRLADFESGQWNGWTATGDAFGPTPAPTPPGLFGHFAVDSTRFGAGARGALRSPEFTIGHAHLRFTLSGPRDPALRVLLLDGQETAFEVSPTGGAGDVEWNVGPLAGRKVVLVIEDRSPTGGLAVDEIVAY